MHENKYEGMINKNKSKVSKLLNIFFNNYTIIYRYYIILYKIPYKTYKLSIILTYLCQAVWL